MNSGLYECQVMHARFTPRAHRFVYRLFYLAVDLDELPALDRSLRLFSVNRRNLYALREPDFFPTTEKRHHPTGRVEVGAAASSSLRERVDTFLAAHGVARPGRVVLIALPRIAGYLFNPVAFYFCWDQAGVPVAAIAEVTNTFRERKLYLLDPATRSEGNGAFHLRVPKHFYVSPFSDVDVAFDFILRVPGDRLGIRIDDYTNGSRTLATTLRGNRRELSDTRLAWFTVKYPLLSLAVMARIHWHAFRLWLKRVPWYAKAARSTDQRDVYFPHASLRNDALATAATSPTPPFLQRSDPA